MTRATRLGHVCAKAVTCNGPFATSHHPPPPTWRAGHWCPSPVQEGKPVEIPIYDFATHRRCTETRKAGTCAREGVGCGRVVRWGRTYGGIHAAPAVVVG